MKVKGIVALIVMFLMSEALLAAPPKSISAKYLKLLSEAHSAKASQVWEHFQKEVPLSERGAVLGKVLQESALRQTKSNVANSILDYLAGKQGEAIQLDPVCLYQIGRLARTSSSATRERVVNALGKRITGDESYLPLFLCFLADHSDTVRERAVALLPKTEGTAQILLEFTRTNEGRGRRKKSVLEAEKRLAAMGVRYNENAKGTYASVPPNLVKKIAELWSTGDGNSGLEGKLLLKKEAKREAWAEVLKQLWIYADFHQIGSRRNWIKIGVLGFISEEMKTLDSPSLTYLVSAAAMSHSEDVGRLAAIVYLYKDSINWPMVSFLLSDPNIEIRKIAMMRAMYPKSSRRCPIVKSYLVTNRALSPKDPLLASAKSYVGSFSKQWVERQRRRR